MFKTVDSFIATQWKGEVLDALKAFITVPSKSPAFDPQWETHGFLLEVASDAANYGKTHFPNDHFDVLTEKGHSPCLFFDIAASDNYQGSQTVLFYGHLDKQPEADGWTNGREPFKPKIEGNRLYGRGAVDDGYSVYCALTAVQALKEAHLEHPRVFGLIETGEESGSPDLAFWLEKLAPKMGNVGFIAALDSAAGDYERFWISTSFRGIVAATLKVSVLEHGMHSGTASGIVPDSFTIARSLLDRIENSVTGSVIGTAFQTQIPSARLAQLKATAAILDGYEKRNFVFTGKTRTKGNGSFESMLMQAWEPQLAIIGADGLPPTATAGNVLRASTSLRLSIRIPPHVDSKKAALALKEALLSDPPFNATIEMTDISTNDGWDALPEQTWFSKAANDVSQEFFGKDCAYIAEGGSIPILNLFSSYFESAQFFVTGALGPQSNAHGPDEMLRLDYAEKLTAAIARLMVKIP